MLDTALLRRGLPFVFLCVPFASPGQAPVGDPVPTPNISEVSVHYREFATIPASYRERPFARINMVEPFSRAQGWLGVNDLNGFLYVVNPQGTPTLYLDLKAAFPDFFYRETALALGFASFAAHPKFDENGRFYTAHSELPNSGTPTLPLPRSVNEQLQGVVTEWIADDPTNPVFSGTHREVLRIDLPGTAHGMQEVAFRPNIDPDHPDYGLLYICIGDGTSYQKGLLANIGINGSPLGTVLRIDPMGIDGPRGRYGVPADNPFMDVRGALREVWAYGFRNPHRIAWDNANDRMLVTDIGEKLIEELNVVERGGNYGWPEREGSFLFNPTGDGDEIFSLPSDDAGFSYPVSMYDHDDGFAIAGGFVYRGSRIPELSGMFLASDIKNGKLFKVPADDLEPGTTTLFERWQLRDENGIVDPHVMVGSENRTDLRIGKDRFGDIYILTKQDGKIRKLVQEGEPEAGYGIFEGYPWNDDWVDARGFVGWTQVEDYPWVWLDSLQKHIYAAPSTQPEGWIYVPN